MKLSISNIAWKAGQDQTVYKMMQTYGFTGLEIAPTRIFPKNPYQDLEAAKEWAKSLTEEYGFTVPSMQSIWFGKTERIFGTKEEREELLSYTKKAIDFASSIGCKNLVFGCPKNRFLQEGEDVAIAIPFFRELGEYAFAHGTLIGMEANPPIYNTNYINNTLSAFELIDEVHSEGFKLNFDLGTVICNQEDLNELIGRVHMINHVHISEPSLNPIEKRELHAALKTILQKEDYQGFVSIEMGNKDNLDLVENAMKYIKEIFAS